ncbi:hypothetical protein L2734_17530 [Parashewanella spongiae]|uniref:hypothetical protein n=1 Tax=Parashewanella spongiae TaxID=342950 RepID=UPI00105A9EE1|nr:hypothetical protein [Parashewanella spongiae]MCL1079940.1 hypothetical protein [Parashewanella spongiae]
MDVMNKSSHETSYYITSLASDVEGIARYIRKHWAIENSQYWVLDGVCHRHIELLRKNMLEAYG